MKKGQTYQSPIVSVITFTQNDVIRTSYDKGDYDIFGGGEVQELWQETV